MAEERGERFTEMADRYAGYQVYDRDQSKVGKVDDLFVDDRDEPEYLGVKMGFLGMRSTLIPMEIVRIDEGQSSMEVASDKQTVKDGPTFDSDGEISRDFEERVHDHYGLRFSEASSPQTESAPEYGPYYPGASGSTYVADDDSTGRSSSTGSANAGTGMSTGGTDSGSFREHPPSDEGPGERESDVEDEDELRVQRSEEELRPTTHEREAGSVNVRKRVRTDHERMTVPKRRERVRIERVESSGEPSESEIGEDEARMPVTEEEVEVTKRPVKKEEVRVRKEPVEEEETVEGDVRREEVDVDDETERGADRGDSRDT